MSPLRPNPVPNQTRQPARDTQGQAENKPTFWLKAAVSSGQPPDLIVKCAIVEEALSELTTMRVEFLCRDRALNLSALLGQKMTLCYADHSSTPRYFQGLCVQAECIGQYQGMARFVAEVRPPLWFLTRRQDCRIFQNEKIGAIVQNVLQDAGLSADLKLNLTGQYDARPYCVQYRESDFAFFSRLLEEDGIYYYFTHDDKGVTTVLADAPGQHKAMEGGDKLEFVESETVELEYANQVFEWTASDQVTSGRASLVSYDFERPNQSLQVGRGMSFGQHPHNSAEFYDNEGRYITTEHGERLARARMEAEHLRSQTWSGLSNGYRIAPGATFTLTNSPRSGEPTDFMVIRATHYIQRDEDARQDVVGVHAAERALSLGRHSDKPYRCQFSAIPKSIQYRPARVTPWPNVGGVHTATVTGPGGEEIHTDEYGRIKIQFHWDRYGAGNDKYAIWVRTMMPWTGKNWGMIAVPRIGNEVVVQFEEGDPDRPIVIGMVYNGTNMPPYKLPDNKTVSGVKTNSSKGGDGYNELIFEDKKGAELMRLHAERDFLQVVENNASISIGREKAAGGDLTQVVNRNRTAFTGLIDSDLTGGIKSTAVGGAIAETVMGVKTTSVGFHVYETVGFNPKALKNWGWALDGITSGVSVASGVFGVTPGDDDGATDGIEGFGLIAALKGLWGATSDYGSIAGPAATAAIGIYGAKGLVPGKTTEVNGDVNLEVNKRMAAKGDHNTKISDGDVTLAVKKGSQMVDIHKNHIENVWKGDHVLRVHEGKQTVEVMKGNREITVNSGDLDTEVDAGKMTTKVQKDYDLKVKMGDIKVKADLGEVTVEAMKKITLKVGQNKIEISQMGIKLEGMMIESKSKMMTTIDGGLMTEVKGTFVMIN